MYKTYHDSRCPQCKRLLFKTLKVPARMIYKENFSHSQENSPCAMCRDHACYEYSLAENKSPKCPKCTLNTACDQCRHFYYRAWAMEKDRVIEIKCPKCKKIVALKYFGASENA